MLKQLRRKTSCVSKQCSDNLKRRDPDETHRPKEGIPSMAESRVEFAVSELRGFAEEER